MNSRGLMAISCAMALAVAAPAFAADDAGKGQWNDRASVQSNFVKSCVEASSPASRSFCQCLAENLSNDLAYDRFRAMDEEYRGNKASDVTRQRMEAAAKACS